MQKVDIRSIDDANLNLVTVDETVIQLNPEQNCLYAVVGFNLTICFISGLIRRINYKFLDVSLGTT